MDIGNQQRVIIVEPDQVVAPVPEPMPAPADDEGFELIGEWPLPIAIEADRAPVD